MIFDIHHTHFELTTYINFGFHNSKDNRDIARNVAAFWVIQAIYNLIREQPIAFITENAATFLARSRLSLEL